ncbi:PxKF domain-containing protein [Micromonospora mangrovi]|uniref:PxKF domain-containing protein n=2 Tax=Micromonospora TaxID=1873 RepID=A0AAU7M0M0_9ACTN
MHRRPHRLFSAAVVAVVVLAAGLTVSASPASAANGDLVQQTSFAQSCGSGIGVGIAFDGKNIWYSCYASSPDLYKADPITGAVLASYTVAGGLGALAWDGNRKKIWAGWGGAGTSGDVRLVDPATGTGAVVLNAAAAAFDELDDGLAYDAQDDSLYVSPDTSTTIYHYSTAGANLGSFPWTGSGCYNSGLAIGGQLLFQGSDGCNHIWVVQRGSHAAAFDFATGAGGVRDEDLECDSVTFSPRTVMWSMEAYEPRRAIAFEIPPGSCATGGGVDRDGDGLLDEWETAGVTIDPDGAGPTAPQFVDLPAMGADVNKPDIFLQVDWMQDATHNQRLSAAAIKTVVDSFAASPYTSPTGSVGINLHVDEGPTSIMNHATNATWGSLSRANQLAYTANLGTSGPGGYDWSAFQTLKDANFTPTGRTPIFHYVIAAHNYDSTTSSGISRGIGASDLIVSLGSFTGGTGTDNEQAGTLMHELGHNLALRHGGGDDVNYKPNYLSIMSYGFQLGGVIKGGAAGTFDYSRSALGALNESSLSEPAGIGAAGYGTRHWCPASSSYVAVNNAGGAIDWNCNGNATETGVSFDVNNDSATNTLNGFNDWANLKLKGGAIGLAGVTPSLPTVTADETLTVEEAKKVPPVSRYTFSGFFSPVDNPPTVNVAKAGSAIPVKFSLGGDQGLNVFAAGSPASQQVACDSGAPLDDIEQTVSAGSATLTYDAVTDRYTYVWKTDRSWAGSCRRLVVTFDDGTQRTAEFRLK